MALGQWLGDADPYLAGGLLPQYYACLLKPRDRLRQVLKGIAGHALVPTSSHLP